MAQYAADAPRGVLEGIRILDLSRLVAGNTLTQMLGDFGADVVKVEPRTGDTLRGWKVKGVETTWKIYSRNKRSLGLEFRHARSQDVLRRLAASANVFIESFRPDTLENMGLSPEVLLEANPKLVIVRISGWGQDGPYRQRPGFGTLVEGMSGLASMNGYPDREPLLPPSYLADSVAGLSGAAAVLLALREVEVNGGQGQVIDLPLFDPLFSVLGPHAANYRLTGKPKARNGSRSSDTAPRNVYETVDGQFVCVSASTQGMAERLLDAIGHGELFQDPRFSTVAARLQNVDELDGIIAEFISSRTLAENIAFFEGAEVTAGPLYDISQIIEDPHIQARGLIEDYPDADMKTLPMHAVPVRLSETPGTIRSPAPTLGLDSRDVLTEAGFGEDEVESLIGDGCVLASDTPAEEVNDGS